MDPALWKKAVTQTGQNENAVFSSQGDRLLLISRDRLAHRQRQLYELKLEDRSERRLTFQDGEVLEATYSPFDGTIYYASTTDEMKEKPNLFYPDLYKGPWPLTEVYRIRKEDELHERLTQMTGFDGFINIHNLPGKGPSITLSHEQNGHLVLLRSPVQRIGFQSVLARPKNHALGFTSHPREAWTAWIEENPSTQASEIFLNRRGQKIAPIPTGLREIRHLRLWSGKDARGLSSEKSSDEDVHLLFTAKSIAGGPRQAYWMPFAKRCLIKMDLGPGEITSLDISSDQQRLAWTLAQGASSQVFVDTLTMPSGLCETITAASTSESAAPEDFGG